MNAKEALNISKRAAKEAVPNIEEGIRKVALEGKIALFVEAGKYPPLTFKMLEEDGYFVKDYTYRHMFGKLVCWGDYHG